MRRAQLALIVLLLSTFVFIAACGHQSIGLSQQQEYYRIVVVADPHYAAVSAQDAALVRKGNDQLKIQAAEQISAWADVDFVAVVGDIVLDTGSVREYVWAKEFVNKLGKPAVVMAGNHEYMYEDEKTADGRLRRGSSDLKKQKLAHFKQTFGLKELYYSQIVNGYLLCYLAPDVTDSAYLTEISVKQQDWLRNELARNRKLPTIVFFHAPLRGTLYDYNTAVNTSQYVAQPETVIRDILSQNPQVMLWVSGHTHTAATNPSFNADINRYNGGVTNIHNASMTGKTIYTNSLYLYRNKVIVKTFNHQKQEWVDALTREFSGEVLVPVK